MIGSTVMILNVDDMGINLGKDKKKERIKGKRTNIVTSGVRSVSKGNNIPAISQGLI